MSRTFQDLHLHLAASCLLASAVSLACGAESPVNSVERVGSVDSALKGAGVATDAIGVVSITSDITNHCTGTIIAPDAIVTAAHCFNRGGAGAGTESGTANFTIHYYDFNGPQYERVLAFQGAASWFAYPGYRRSHTPLDYWIHASFDTGLIIVPGLSGLDHHDYMRVYSDADGPLSGRHLVFGAGVTDDDLNDDDYLYEARYDVTDVGGSMITVDNASNVGVCLGDSGGPFVMEATRLGKTVPLLAGDLALQEGISGGCIDGWPFDDAHYSRVDSKMGWIEGLLGQVCTKMAGPSNLFFKRCFELPFIEDVDGEGLSRGTATAAFLALL